MLTDDMKKRGLRTDSVVIQADVWESAQGMTPETKGRFYQAVMDYSFTGHYDPQGDPIVDIVMTAIKRKIDAHVKHHLDAIEKGHKGAESGKDGGRPTKEMQSIMDAWNAMAKEHYLPTQEKFSGSIMKNIRSVLASGESVEDIIEVIKSVGDSDYLQGANASGVKCHFAWLLEPEHYDRVKSGHYTSGRFISEEGNSNPF